MRGTVLQRVTGFIGEVKTEMKKVAWATKDELIGSTVVVIVSVLLLAVLIGAWDFLLSKLQALIYYK